MRSIRERKLRTSDALFGAELTPKMLQRVIEVLVRNNIAPGPREGWRQFTLAEVGLLALVRLMMQHGMPLTEALGTAGAVLERATGIDDPDVLLDTYQDACVVLYLHDGDWHYRLDLSGGPLRPIPGPVFTMLDIGAVLSRAFSRALTSEDRPPLTDWEASYRRRVAAASIPQQAPTAADAVPAVRSH